MLNKHTRGRQGAFKAVGFEDWRAVDIMLSWLSALGSIRYDEIEILLLDWRAFIFKSYKIKTYCSWIDSVTGDVRPCFIPFQPPWKQQYENKNIIVHTRIYLLSDFG